MNPQREFCSRIAAVLETEEFMFFRKSKKRPGNSVKDRCAALDGKKLRCVSERTDGIETIIARQGLFAFRDGYLLIYADGADPIFKCLPEETEAGELMSLEGIVITAPDYMSGGRSRTVVAYYKYWREVSE